MTPFPKGAGALFTTATRWRLALALAGSLVTALLDMAGVAAMVPLLQIISGDENAFLVDRLFRILGPGSTQRDVAVALAVLIVVLFTLKGALTIAFRWWQLGFVANEQIRTSTQLLRSYLTAPYAMFLRRTTPELLRTMGDAVSKTYNQVVMGTLGMITEVLTITALALLVIVSSPVPALIALVYFGAGGVFLNRQVKKRSGRIGEDVLEHSATAFKTVLHAIGGVKEIKIRHNAENFISYYERSQRDLTAATRRFGFLSEVPKYLLEILFVGGVALMTVLSLASEDSDSALAQLALFAAAGTRILPSTTRLLANLSNIRYGLPGMRLVTRDLQEYDARTAGASHRGAGDPVLPRGDLRLERVSFSYEGGPLVLDDVDLTVPRGTSLAVVGSSGAGKTTLIDIVLGLLSPTSGTVTVGGTDIRTDLTGWQRSIGLVPQAVYLFSDTLAVNIAFGEELTPEARRRLTESASRAQLDDVISHLPQGLDSDLGQDGSRLSGGQAQRIGIARALFSNPDVIVLDEATSALDTITERHVSEAVAQLAGDTTVIIVAHRLSTVRHCDQLVFLEGGRISGIGTFDEVRATNEQFARMVRLGSIDPPAPGPA